MSTRFEAALKFATALAVLLTAICVLALIVASRGTLVSGVGNSGNIFYTDTRAQKIAELAVALDVAPDVDDDVLKMSLDAILGKATAGDAEATRVMLEIAKRRDG
jgi:hypothetical protein